MIQISIVLARYPMFKYILAVFLSRTPHFYLLAFIGHATKIPDYLLIVLFILLVTAMNATFVKNMLKKSSRKNNAS